MPLSITRDGCLSPHFFFSHDDCLKPQHNDFWTLGCTLANDNNERHVIDGTPVDLIVLDPPYLCHGLWPQVSTLVKWKSLWTRMLEQVWNVQRVQPDHPINLCIFEYTRNHLMIQKLENFHWKFHQDLTLVWTGNTTSNRHNEHHNCFPNVTEQMWWYTPCNPNIPDGRIFAGRPTTYFCKGRSNREPNAYLGYRRRGLGSKRKSEVQGEKPLELAERLVTSLCAPGHLVLDFFGGMGTFGLACLLHGRNYRGVEINPLRWGRAVERIVDSVYHLPYQFDKPIQE